MRVITNQSKVDEILKEQEGIPVEEINTDDQIGIVGYLDTCWSEAREAKEDIIEAQIVANLKQIDGQYDADKLAAIKEIGGSEVFVMITDAKVKNATNWVEELLFQPGQRPWDISPSPVPELPANMMDSLIEELVSNIMVEISSSTPPSMGMVTPEQMPIEVINEKLMDILPRAEEMLKESTFQRAKELAEKISKEVDDKLTEGGWYSALRKCIPWIVTHTGFITGPVMKKRPTIKIMPLESGRLVAQVVNDVIPTYESISPLYMYPAPDSISINDGYLFERMRLSPIEIQNMIGVKNYNEDEVRAVLAEIELGEIKSDWLTVDQEISELGGGISEIFYDSSKIDCLKFTGAIKGSLIKEWGQDKDPDGEKIDEDFYYNVFIYKIGKHIISIQYNNDALGEKPYYKTSFENRDGCFWGKGLPEIIYDAQNICNAVARAIVNNSSMASGPQVERNIDRIPAASRGDNKLIPWKVWDSTNEMMTTGHAFQFHQPTLISNQLLEVYKHFSRVADEHSGVPAFAHGDTQVGGAGNALASYERILTPSGPVAISCINVGDKVVTSSGGYSNVTGVFPQGESEIYRIRFNNGEYIDCDLNHRWSVRTHHNRKFKTLTTKEILDKGLYRNTIIGWRNPKSKRPKWMLPIVGAIEFDKRDLKIDPYTMGAILGDGDSRCRLTSMDKEIFDRIPYELGKPDYKSNDSAWTCTIKGIKNDYISYGLNCKSTEKFIPTDYLFTSISDRLDLLRGMMDTDGCCSKSGEVFYSTSSHRLAKDFIKLVRSLGGIVSSICEEDGKDFDIKGKQCTRKTNYRIVFNLSWERIFYLDRKQSRVKLIPKTHTYITSVDYIGKDLATCISVDSIDNLYICENYIATHNTASGLSMLMGSAARGIKALIKSIDEDIIKPSVKKQYVWLIEREDYFGMVCDYNIVSGGSIAALAREQMVARRLEFMNNTANPVDVQIMGMEGRKYVIEETAKSLGLDLTKYLPKKMPEQSPQQPQFQPPGSGSQQLDAAGNPIVGQDTRQFN